MYALLSGIVIYLLTTLVAVSDFDRDTLLSGALIAIAGWVVTILLFIVGYLDDHFMLALYLSFGLCGYTAGLTTGFVLGGLLRLTGITKRESEHAQ